MTIDLEELKRLAEDGSPGEFEANVGPSVVLELIRLLENTQFAAAKEASRCTELECAESKALKERLDALTDDGRLELFGHYCKSCGCKDPRCQCWNDE